ncbi:MAG: OmpA family protein [Prevotellaceae bacterium]|jgi:peptidoglycan-associated lipoprotein|nr:OmpA family protein [Prevotellaceae bacterium]
MKKIIFIVLMAISTMAFTQENIHNLTKILTQNSNVWGAIPTVNGEIIFVENKINTTNGIYISRLVIKKKDNKESTLSNFEQYQNIGSPFISIDGKEFYFVVSGTVRSIAVKNIFKSSTTYYPLQLMVMTNTGNEWTNPVEFQYNSNKYSNSDPCLSQDGTYLYFVSDMQGGYGNSDIYRCKRNTDGSWGKPENLGSNINTKGNERFPRIDNKGNLYFSSNMNGNLDLFVCSPDGNDFKSPVKMDKPFNSDGDDFAISFIDENSGYISSNRDGVDHIYLFEPLITKKTEPVRKNDTITKVADTIKTIEKIKPTDTDKAVEIVAPDIALSDLLKKGKLQYINFDFDKWRIAEKHIPALKDLIHFMQQYPTVIMEVAGYTDCIGKNEYNLKLSHNRAVSVRDYLVANGIDSNRVVAKEFGSTNPLIDCEKSTTEAAHGTNRRVEYKILKY